jgi:hypothetical protein
MTDSDASEREPSQCQIWEIGVSEAGDPETWEHHHPLAKTASAAQKQAQRASDLCDPIVYMTEGPFKPDDVDDIEAELEPERRRTETERLTGWVE